LNNEDDLNRVQYFFTHYFFQLSLSLCWQILSFFKSFCIFLVLLF
jgi:hypothetical protein